MSDNYNSNRILKNSILLYGRMLFTMWINLYATRLTLQNLGVEDMGVYGVVGSIVSIFSVFIGGITTAIQRFITFEAGLKNGNVNKVFYSSLNVIFILAIFILILLESVGLYFLFFQVNIPEVSKNAAFWVFQFSTLTCLVSLISIPYNALIIAHEKMDVFATISIIQVVLNCVSAYLISFFDNRLLLYALFIMIVSITVQIIYQIYCRINFPEAKYRRTIDKGLIRNIGKYTGVSTTSGMLQVVANQGVTLIINWTVGVAFNAVYNIANQLKNSIMSFALNLMKAVSPQITKTYANGEMETHKKLVYSGSKMEIYLFYFILFPFLFRTEYIMKLWLGDPLPSFIVEFVQCTVLVGLVYSAFEPIRAAVLATGHIVKFMLIPESFYLLVLPVSYFCYNLTQSVICLIVSIVVMDILAAVVRVYFASRVSMLKLKEIVKKILVPAFAVAVVSNIVCYILDLYCSNSLLGLCLLLILNSILLSGIIYIIGLSQHERLFINKIILRKLMRK